MATADRGVIKINSRPTDKDELLVEVPASIAGFNVQPKTGAMNLALLIDHAHLTPEALDLGRHMGMELVVQIYKARPRPDVLTMARNDELGVGDDELDEALGEVLTFVTGLQQDKDKGGDDDGNSR